MPNFTFSRLLRVTTLLLAAPAIVACASDLPDNTTESENASTNSPYSEHSALSVPLASLPESVRARARAKLGGLQQGPNAGEFKDLIFGSRAIAISRPDVDGIAYYEVRLERAGAPRKTAGYMLLASGAHDHPVVSYGRVDETPAEAVARASESLASIERFVQVDAVTLLAESRDGQVLGLDGPASPGGTLGGHAADQFVEDRLGRRWASARNELRSMRSTYFAALAEEGAKAWGPDLHAGTANGTLGEPSLNILRCNVDGDGCDPSEPHPSEGGWLPPLAEYWARRDPAGGDITPRYNQLAPQQSPNPASCHSGCGPTAAAILLGWADAQHQFGGTPSLFARPEMNFIPNYTWNPRDTNDHGTSGPMANLQMDIRRAMSTFCFSDQGVTLPTTMHEVQPFLVKPRGWPVRLVQHVNPIWVGEPGIRDAAVASLRDQAAPAILGLQDLLGQGTDYHYAVAEGVRIWRSGDVEFRLNMGWGGTGNRWQTMGGSAYAMVIQPAPTAAPRRTSDVNADKRSDLALIDTSFMSGLTFGLATPSNVQGLPVGLAGINDMVAQGGAILSGDFNGDGRKDFALVGGAGWTTVPVYFGEANGLYRLTNVPTPSFPEWSRVPGVTALAGDFNGDGKDDLALTGGAGWWTTPIAYSRGDGSFEVTNPVAGEFPTWATVPGARAVVGDFDADGVADMALVGGQGWWTVPIRFSRAGRGFEIANQPVGDFAIWATQGAKPYVGDFDGDGMSDIALVGGGPNWTTLPLAMSNGAGAFSIVNHSLSEFARWGAEGSQAAVGDYDGDGRDDIALVKYGWPAVGVAFSRTTQFGMFRNINFAVELRYGDQVFNTWRTPSSALVTEVSSPRPR